MERSNPECGRAPPALSRLRDRQRSALTLIEVVTATAMAGTLLVGLLLAFSGHTRQLKQLQFKQQAVKDLDRFLNHWAAFEFSDERFVEACEQSVVLPFLPGRTADKAFSTREESVSEPHSLIRIMTGKSQLTGDFQLQVVRVEAYRVKKALAPRNSNSMVGRKPLAWVEILRSRTQRSNQSG